MYQRALLKEEVKQAMRGTRPRPMWIALLFSLILGVGAWLINSLIGAVFGIGTLTRAVNALLVSGYGVEEAFRQLLWAYGPQLAAVISSLLACCLIASLLSWLWSGLMNVGFKGYCLSMTRQEQPSVGKLFCGFPLVGKVLLTRLLVWVFITLWSLLYAVGFAVVAVIGALLAESVPALSAILFILGYIAVLVLEVRLTLRYALTDYVLLDQDKYGLEAVTESKLMMKGNKGRLFMLQLSFIGWYLVEFAIILVGVLAVVLICLPAIGSLTAHGLSFGVLAGAAGGVILVLLLVGVGSLLFSSWLAPYVTGAYARFYEFLKGQQAPAGGGWPAADGSSSSYTSAASFDSADSADSVGGNDRPDIVDSADSPDGPDAPNSPDGPIYPQY